MIAANGPTQVSERKWFYFEFLFIVSVGEYACAGCERVFPSSQKLRDHRKAVHAPSGMLQLLIGRILVSKEMFRKPSGMFECKCGSIFASSSGVRKHSKCYRSELEAMVPADNPDGQDNETVELANDLEDGKRRHLGGVY